MPQYRVEGRGYDSEAKKVRDFCLLLEVDTPEQAQLSASLQFGALEDIQVIDVAAQQQAAIQAAQLRADATQRFHIVRVDPLRSCIYRALQRHEIPPINDAEFPEAFIHFCTPHVPNTPTQIKTLEELEDALRERGLWLTAEVVGEASASHFKVALHSRAKDAYASVQGFGSSLQTAIEVALQAERFGKLLGKVRTRILVGSEAWAVKGSNGTTFSVPDPDSIAQERLSILGIEAWVAHEQAHLETVVGWAYGEVKAYTEILRQWRERLLKRLE